MLSHNGPISVQMIQQQIADLDLDCDHDAAEVVKILLDLQIYGMTWMFASGRSPDTTPCIRVTDCLPGGLTVW
jgi:hypothetical protein